LRNDICTIPVNEVFETVDGCPMCRMQSTVENHILDYIMGAAMMEPDVRTQTNRLGFCPDHLHKMLSRRGRLSLALMLESHMDMLKDAVKDRKKAAELEKSCFICEKIDWGMSRMTDTVCRSYETDRDFRALFDRQDCFCLEHYNMLLRTADKRIMRHHYKDLIKSLTETTSSYAAAVREDLKKYCSMSDYRNSGADADWGNSRDAVERAARFLGDRNAE
jgi:hypothetical protein